MKKIAFIIGTLFFLACSQQKPLVDGKGKYPHPNDEQAEYLENHKKSVNPPTQPENRYPEKRKESKNLKMSPY